MMELLDIFYCEEQTLIFCVNVNTQISAVGTGANHFFPRNIKPQLSERLDEIMLCQTSRLKAVSYDNKII